VVVAVTPAVDWGTLKGPDRKDVEASLPAFLLQHRDLDAVVGALSGR
jgi:hypothetical protein